MVNWYIIFWTNISNSFCVPVDSSASLISSVVLEEVLEVPPKWKVLRVSE